MTLFRTTLLSSAAAILLVGTSAMAAPVGSMSLDRANSQITGADSAANVIKVRSRGNRESRRNHRSRHREWRGHRGYRDYRRGYRRHSDGWWYPLAAFSAGIMGGAIGNSIYNGNSHVEWCENNYRSYRRWDNTFQPYNGPRRQCNSPYG